MPVNSTHPEYDAILPVWSRARDVIAGEDAVKSAGIRYLPRLPIQSDDEYAAYKERASFFNATARTAEGLLGLVFRRTPFVKLPEDGSALAKALAKMRNDVDMLGTPLSGYAKRVVNEVIAVGRAGTLVDWEGDAESRVFATMYGAEQILNWRVERINGRNVPTMVVLAERGGSAAAPERDIKVPATSDPFVTVTRDQIRVLKLVPRGAVKIGDSNMPSSAGNSGGGNGLACVVEMWQPKDGRKRTGKVEWQLIETRVPLRLGKPLPLLPFVFHGPGHSQPPVDKVPLDDIIAINLDHYRLNADYKHGAHYTALPTAWVSGFEKEAVLRIGASTAWVASAPGAAAGFLEFTGQGLTTFERAMDRDERLMSILGSRLLEAQKRAVETAEAIQLRQTGESSILGNIATNVGTSLTHVLRWAYWWNSTQETPNDVTDDQVLMELNTDFSMKGMDAQAIQAVVAAWQAGAISRDTMTELFRHGEVLPEGRSTAEEEAMITAEGTKAPHLLRPPSQQVEIRDAAPTD
jgi:hypothetical protein